MSEQKNLKRSGPAAEDAPNKKAATSKLGRPRNVVGDEQFNHMMSGLPDYLVEKRKKALKQPHNIGKVFDDKTVDFIAKYGWENPFRTLQEDVDDATAEARVAAAAEVAEVKKAVAKGPEATDAAKFAIQARKDEVVIAVRAEIAKLYGRAFREGEPGAAKPSVDIPKLIKAIMAKPTQRQLYMVWSKLRVRQDLESEVDRRHAAALELKGDSSRGAVWNVVASEWFNACSEDEKVITRREALKILDIELKSWEEQAAADPASPEEARAFMEGSEEFLSAMMQFFANRVSGIAVMFLAGPKEVSLSEAVCDTPGKPKVLYSQVADEETTLRLMGARILSQSRLMNETKWGVQLDEDEPAKQDDVQAEPMDVDSSIDPALHQPSAFGTEADAAAPYPSTAETGSYAAVEISSGRAEHATSTGVERTSELASTSSEQAVLKAAPDTPPQPENASPTDAATTVAEAKSKAARARVLLAKAEAEAADAEAAVLAEVAARAAAAKATQDTNVKSPPAEYEQPANTAAQKPAVAPTITPTPTGAGVPAGNASVMAFDPCVSLAGLRAANSEYKAAFEQASQTILSRKTWWDQTNNSVFFKSVPQKMEQGKVDVAVGCELSLAYLALEQSGAAEGSLELVSSNDGRCLPEYLAIFGATGRDWAARWHKRASSGGNRTRAALDADINTTLPRQWASLQPQARLDSHGRISVPAHASMVWSSGISPGREGVRALVVTLLNWGSHVKYNSDEQAEWRYVAADVAQVLRILAEKGGRYQSSAPPQGRQRLPSAKVRDVNRSE